MKCWGGEDSDTGMLGGGGGGHNLTRGTGGVGSPLRKAGLGLCVLLGSLLGCLPRVGLFESRGLLKAS